MHLPRFCATTLQQKATKSSTSTTAAWRSSAWDLCEEAADLFGKCLKQGKWPGYPRDPQRLSPPEARAEQVKAAAQALLKAPGRGSRGLCEPNPAARARICVAGLPEEMIAPVTS